MVKRRRREDRLHPSLPKVALGPQSRKPQDRQSYGRTNSIKVSVGTALPTTQDSTPEWANARLKAIEDLLDADCLTIVSPTQLGLEHRSKVAIEAREERKQIPVMIRDTAGGVVEIVERIIRVLRQHYLRRGQIHHSRSSDVSRGCLGDVRR